MKNGRYIAATALALLAFAALAGQALAAGYSARALRPSYDSSALELSGSGAYRTAAVHSELRVTVCLSKRFGTQTFTVRCSTATGSGRRVKGQVSVPGCVRGTWRTTATGEALNRRGEWVHQASSTSRPFHC